MMTMTMIMMSMTLARMTRMTAVMQVWHGLVLLPVLLALVGPAAYPSARPPHSLQLQPPSPNQQPPSSKL